MIPIYLCDDEPQMAMRLEKMIRGQVTIHAFDMGPIVTCDNPDALLTAVRAKQERGIYFLDIDFPGFENGLELAAQIRQIDPRGFIVFITGHADFALETFRYRLEVLDYIVKDVDSVLMGRVQSCLQSIYQRVCDESGEGSHFLTLKILDQVHHIPHRQILFFEAVGRNHQISLHMQERVMHYNGSLRQLETELGEAFWRCHRGFLVNTYHISRIFMRENEIELDNGARCLMARRAKLNIPEHLKVRV